MIELPRSPNYQKNAARIRGDYAPCAVCGKAVIKGNKAVHIVRGGGYVANQFDAIDPAGDCGIWPIGPECIKAHPELKPYLIVANEEED